MNKVFTDNGWADYLYCQTEDRKTLRKINQLIEDISRNGNTGIGKPWIKEILQQQVCTEESNQWSRKKTNI